MSAIGAASCVALSGGTWLLWHTFVLRPAMKKTTPWGPRWLATGLSGSLYRFACWWLNVTHDVEDAIQRGIFRSGKQYMVVWHPHGSFTVAAVYVLSHFWAKGYPEKNLFVCVAGLLLNIPGLAEFLLLCGARPGDGRTFSNLLAQGRTVAVQPGGIAEQVHTDDKREIAYFAPRLGFVRLAIKHGVPLLPCYAFGENQLYPTNKFVRSLNVWFYKNLHTGSLVVLGLGGVPNSPVLANPGMLPTPGRGLHVRFGEPVEVGPAEAEPSEERVLEVFESYVAGLQKLFDAHKDACLPKDVAARGLEIVRRGSAGKAS